MKRLPKFIPGGAGIVFVILLAIVLPSVLLSVFAIWAIGAERAKVQDRIRREARAMTNRVVDATFRTLTSAKDDMAGEVGALKAPEMADGLLDRLKSSRPYFAHIVLIDDRGVVVFPPMPRSETMIVLGPADVELQDALNKAQNLEFVQTDLEAAADAYREALAEAQSPRLRVSALLGLARIWSGQGKTVEAIEGYRDTRDEYGSEREENGMLVGPVASLRIVELVGTLDNPDQFTDEATAAYAQVAKMRDELTREEADFLDERLASLIESYIGRDIAGARQHEELRRIVREISLRRVRESVAAQAVEELTDNLVLHRDGLAVFETGKTQFILLGARTDIAGKQYFACALAPVRAVEQELVAGEVGRLAAREEVEVAVVHNERGVVAGKPPEIQAFHLAERQFPEPLSNLRAEAYLKGYESLSALSDIRTNIYVWAVGLAISGIIAGAIVTYVSVRRTMRAAELKSDFVSNVTHELKTPLTSIRMFAETLHDGRVKDQDDADECLETIISESERLTRLIDRVLDFRAVEKGRRKFNFIEADLRKVILDTLQTFRRQLRGCEATVYVSIPNDLPTARMDPDAVGEALLNLLTNAYKYSTPENRKIWVTAEESDGKVRISVEDRGVGIPRREFKAIFEKFYRVDDLLTREVDGTGLGLTISRHVAEAHGGAIEVDSKEGKGSKFTLVMKLRATA